MGIVWHMKTLSCAFLVICLGLCSCASAPEQETSTTTQEIKGRDFTGRRFAVYRARVPETWIRRDPLPNESLNDTTKALCEYIIKEKNGIIRISIHNFPTDTIDQRIAPAAQVARWQRQFTSLSPTDYSITPQTFNGYTGLYFKGEGKLHNSQSMMLGWSLVLAPEHYRMLSHGSNDEENKKYREMRADVTIKAIGPISMMEHHEGDISRFARSFELIEEIPQ